MAITNLSNVPAAVSRRNLMLGAGAAALLPLRPRRSMADESAAVTVTMSNRLKFDPPSVTIKAGQTVEWKNGSALVHTVTADPDLAARAKDVALPEGAEPFNSGNLKPDATFLHFFNLPGRYKYFCIPHEAAGMLGEVVVTD